MCSLRSPSSSPSPAHSPGLCISRLWLCDRDLDCRDGSDEAPALCNATCSHTQFRCLASGACIPASWECDGDADCGEGDTSDEHAACAEINCLPAQFTCDTYKCIPEDYRCDGEEDCNDRTDEAGCPETTPTCLASEFPCPGASACLPRERLCDGSRDCPGGEDEADCSRHTCQGDEFTCGDGSCVPKGFLCDGNRDCLDGSDEERSDCTVRCTSKERGCATGSKCIPSQYWCDGDEDCEDGSDELACTVALDCSYPDLLCDQGLNRTKCLEVGRLCDGVRDCKDGTDEGLLCPERQCRSPLNQCSHACHDSPGGHRCSCPPGQTLTPGRVVCAGPEPCSAWGVCSQLCTGVSRGRHKCHCQQGYQLQPDKFTCKSKDQAAPAIVFSNRHELRLIELRRGLVRPLISSLKDTIVVDFLHTNNQTLLYWTDWADDSIYSATLSADASLSNIDTVVHSSLTTAEGLAVDWIGGNLYWIQSSLDQIEVSRLNGSFRQTLIAGRMERPRALALEPREGIIFWTDWDPAGSPRIERCSMDGKEENRIAVYNVSNYGGAWPNGLTVDYPARRIYWTDARSDSIHTARYDGSDPREVLRGHQHLSHPFSLAVFENHIYWTDWRSSAVIRANKWNGSDVTIVEKTISKPFGLKVVHPSVQPPGPAPHPCSQGIRPCR
jgi:integrin beta 2